jgi:hypothetical protein
MLAPDPAMRAGAGVTSMAEPGVVEVGEGPGPEEAKVVADGEDK